MEIKKKKGTFNTYICELSFGQLLAFRNGLASDHADPLADEAYAELNWYLDNVPGPGEEEEDLKREEEAPKASRSIPVPMTSCPHLTKMKAAANKVLLQGLKANRRALRPRQALTKALTQVQARKRGLRPKNMALKLTAACRRLPGSEFLAGYGTKHRTHH